MAFWRSKKTDSSNDSAAEAEAAPVAQPSSSSAASDSTEPKSGGGVFGKMRGALAKTRQALNTDIRDLFKSEGRLVDDEFLD